MLKKGTPQVASQAAEFSSRGGTGMVIKARLLMDKQIHGGYSCL